MIRNIIAKTIIGKEYCYSSSTSVLCHSKEEANKLAEFMNSHNDTANGVFKLKEGEKWEKYEIDKYDTEPAYELICTKDSIRIRPL